MGDEMTAEHAIWYDLHKQGMVFTDIAERYGVTKNAVAGACYRYRARNGLAPAVQQPRKAAILRVKPRAAPVVSRATVPPATVASFSEQVNARCCLYWDGDGDTAVHCGEPRVEPTRNRPDPSYCERHTELCY